MPKGAWYSPIRTDISIKFAPTPQLLLIEILIGLHGIMKEALHFKGWG